MKKIALPGLILAFIFFHLSGTGSAGGCELSGSGNLYEITPGESNNMRSEPRPDAQLIAVIPPADPFIVMEGRHDDGTYLWVEITYHTAQGWTVAKNCITDEEYMQVSYNVSAASQNILVVDTVETPLTINRYSDYLEINGFQMNLAIGSGGTINAHLRSANDRRNQNTGYGYPANLTIWDSNIDRSFHLDIYPAAMFEMYWPETVSILQAALVNQTDDLSDYILHPEPSANLMRIRGQYLNFDWGRGYAMLEVNGNSPTQQALDNYDYSFYGLSHDNRYYVVVSTTTTTTLPAHFYEMTPIRNGEWATSFVPLESANFIMDYYFVWQGVIDYLEPLPDSAFTPDIATIHSWLASFQIPSDLFDEAAFNTPQAYTLRNNRPQAEVTAVPVPDYCGTPYASSLAVDNLATQVLQNDPIRARTTAAGEYAGFDIPPHHVVLITAGPVCAEIDGQMAVWWEILTVDGRTGWVAEGLGDRLFFQKFKSWFRSNSH